MANGEKQAFVIDFDMRMPLGRCAALRTTFIDVMHALTANHSQPDRLKLANSVVQIVAMAPTTTK